MADDITSMILASIVILSLYLGFKVQGRIRQRLPIDAVYSIPFFAANFIAGIFLFQHLDMSRIWVVANMVAYGIGYGLSNNDVKMDILINELVEEDGRIVPTDTPFKVFMDPAGQIRVFTDGIDAFFDMIKGRNHYITSKDGEEIVFVPRYFDGKEYLGIYAESVETGYLGKDKVTMVSLAHASKISSAQLLRDASAIKNVNSIADKLAIYCTQLEDSKASTDIDGLLNFMRSAFSVLSIDLEELDVDRVVNMAKEGGHDA